MAKSNHRHGRGREKRQERQNARWTGIINEGETARLHQKTVCPVYEAASSWPGRKKAFAPRQS